MMRPLLMFTGFALTLSAFPAPTGAALQPPGEVSRMYGECAQQMREELQEERNVYRGVQAGESATSVLGTTAANTSDLVPYLVLNYHALSCRMRSLCDAVGRSHGHAATGPSLSHRPVGCARLFSARGRWWSPDRRDRVFKENPIEECAFAEQAQQSRGDVAGTFRSLDLQPLCDDFADQILREERELLRVMVAQDSSHRGTRKVAGVFQAVLRDIRDSFLEPLRGLADLFGSVIHPIPCLLTQCN